MTHAVHHRRPIALATAVTSLLALAPGRPVRAQGMVEAEVLFEDGKRLLKEGQLAEACAKFEASERIDSAVGVLLNAADCREKNRQLATAWALFIKAASLAHLQGNDARREAEARRRAALLTSRLSYLTLSVPASSAVDGLELRRGGDPISPALWNTGVPVDEGEYQISASAPGHQPWHTSITVRGEGARAVVDVPRFKRLEDLVVPPPSAAPGAGVPMAVAPAGSRPAFTTLRKTSVGLAVAGVAVIGVGIGFGLKARELRTEADGLCPDAACGDPRAVALTDDAQRAAARANLLFIAGGVVTAGAVALWFLGAPQSAEALTARPVVAPGAVGLVLSGGF